jgi:probable HAF family extracellular repeat protein
MSSRLRHYGVILALLGTLSVSPKSQAQTYRATDLGANTVGLAINNAGQIVGYTYPASGPNQFPFLWNNGTLTMLGTLGGSSGQALAINSSGQIVGSSEISGDSATHATLWNNGAVTDLGTLGGTNSRANGINDQGQIVGVSDILCPPANCGMGTTAEYGFIDSGGVMTELPLTDSGSGATGINSAGQIAGYNEESAYVPSDAILWSTSTSAPVVLVGIMGPSYVLHPVVAINNAGQVVTTATGFNLSAVQAALWSNGTVTNLGALLPAGCPPGLGLNCPTGALGINNSGQIVGYGSTWQLFQASIAYFNFAGLWSGGHFFDLNSLVDPTSLPASSTLTYAFGINDGGEIVTQGTVGSVTHTFLLQLETLSLSVTPMALTFSSLLVGKHSAAQPVTVNNTGPTAFGFNPMAVTGDFSQTNNCGVSLAAGSSCAIQIAFTPTAPGTRTGVLTVASGGTSYTVNLMGTGNIVVALTSSAPTTVVGTPVTLSWTAPGTTCTATGGSTADGWTGNLTGSGSMKVTESAVGKYTYGITCAGGGQMANAQVTVTVGLPTVNMSAAPSTLSVGQASTLTWTSTFATTCTASGGGSGDGWSGTKPTSGSASVTESMSGTYTYTLTCISGDKAGQEAAVVTVNARPSSGGGGGAIDKWLLLFLFAAIGLEYGRRRSQPSWR